jgi:branched-chain amino acid transport system ATP-binding protein
VSADSALRVRGLAAGYGSGLVLHGIDFDAPAGTTTAVLGRNGAGKTTFLQTIAGFVKASSGSVSLGEIELTTRRVDWRARKGLGYMPQERPVFNDLTVLDNLKLVRTVQGIRARPIEFAYDLFPKLAARSKQIAGTLSGGERKMLGVARVLLADPKVLMLDEPTEGVWPAVIDELAVALRELHGELTIVLIEQNLEFALGVASTVHVMRRGEIALSGGVDELRGTAQLREAMIS